MEITLVLILMAAAVWLFVSEKLPPASTALIVLGGLLLCATAGVKLGFVQAGRWITTQEAWAGFSNSAVVAVAAMFVLSAGLEKQGLVEGATVFLGRASRSPMRLLLATMLLAAGLSAFANNTAAVAALLPAVISLCAQRGWAASRFLIPLSFAAQFGGVCTLVGTSTNLLVNGIVSRAGQPEFGFFEFAPLGLCLAGAGFLYFSLLGKKLLPDRTSRSGAASEDVWEPGEFVSEVRILKGSPIIGKTLSQTGLQGEGLGLQVLEIIRGQQRRQPGMVELRADDVLLVRAGTEAIEKVRQKLGLALNAEHKMRREDLEQGDLVMAQVLLSPATTLAGRTVAELGFHARYDCIVLGVQRNQSHTCSKISCWRLREGDMLLVLTSRAQLEVLRADDDFIVLRDKEPKPPRGWRSWFAAVTFVAVVAAAAVFKIPVAAAAVIGCAALVGSGCLRLHQAISSIHWPVILLLGCLMPLGLALERSGAAALVAQGVAGTAGALGPVALLAALYLVTAILTEFMSNNAAALLLAPVAISSAAQMGIDPRPLLIAVTFAASTSFATPVGYQTNTMIYGPGGYRFGDFIRVGVPLNLIFWLLSVQLIPLWWKF